MLQHDNLFYSDHVVLGVIPCIEKVFVGIDTCLVANGGIIKADGLFSIVVSGNHYSMVGNLSYALVFKLLEWNVTDEFSPIHSDEHVFFIV